MGASEHVQHALVGLAAEEAAVVVGEVVVSVLGVDGAVEEAAPVLLFGRVRERCAESSPDLFPVKVVDRAMPSAGPVRFAVGPYVPGDARCEDGGHLVDGEVAQSSWWVVGAFFAHRLVEGVPSVAEWEGARDRADDRGALLRRLVVVACKGLLIVLVDACPEGYVGDVFLVCDAERLAGLMRVAGCVGPELGEGVGSFVCARLVSCVAFGVRCLVDSEDDVAVFERGGGCVDRALEGGRDVAYDDGSLSLAFINPCVGLAAVGRVPNDGVVPLISGEEARQPPSATPTSPKKKSSTPRHTSRPARAQDPTVSLTNSTKPYQRSPPQSSPTFSTRADATVNSQKACEAASSASSTRRRTVATHVSSKAPGAGESGKEWTYGGARQ